MSGQARRDARIGPPEPLPWPMDLREAVQVGDVLGISPQVCRGAWPQLPSTVVHGLARLRVDVLVAEARRARPELDEADLAPGTEHLWIPDGEVPVACLRTVRDAAGRPVIDRACARADVRRLGLVSALVSDVIARWGAGGVRALADAGTVTFFAGHGFEVVGSLIVASGIQVTPMLRRPEAPWRE